METLELIDAHQIQSSSSSSSSIDSSNHPSKTPPPSSSLSSSNVFINKGNTKNITDLRSTLIEKQNQHRPFLFVKVYMEGISIGRKLDLLPHHSYDGLVRDLSHMFRTKILYPHSQPLNSQNFHVLTYEDQEGDWMIVGDVPWEMFLNTVKRLRITRAGRY
ncbi:PREDICTED: auxin-responsive protein IAA31-like [Lupinus angustifolius]|uniref:auxin-responsive protein IAA31-like n=1 Tax=Lupinus angustifolius TaxID=3871 RepID=UPI00092ED1B6|nr:PREDICTED: auxin-responsive protein IAA31-like [Lupinus angustifolius]